MKIGRILSELRNKKHLTQDQIADALGVKRPRYNAWENEISNPDLEMIKKIAEFHKVPVDYLLGRNDSPITDKNKNSFSEIDDDVRALARDIQDLDSGKRELLKGFIEAMREVGREAKDKK